MMLLKSLSNFLGLVLVSLMFQSTNSFSYILGCKHETAVNYNLEAQYDDGSCVWNNYNKSACDINGDNKENVNDVLELVQVILNDTQDMDSQNVQPQCELVDGECE